MVYVIESSSNRLEGCWGLSNILFYSELVCSYVGILSEVYWKHIPWLINTSLEPFASMRPMGRLVFNSNDFYPCVVFDAVVCCSGSQYSSKCDWSVR
jgi:hypothetical protein